MWVNSVLSSRHTYNVSICPFYKDSKVGEYEVVNRV